MTLKGLTRLHLLVQTPGSMAQIRPLGQVESVVVRVQYTPTMGTTQPTWEGRTGQHLQ